MNPAIHAAIIAASHQEEIQEKVEAKLRAARAVGPSSAILFHPADDAERKLFEAALAGGSVARTHDGRVYLNESVIADRKEGQGFAALLILLVIASVIASGAVLADFASR